MVLKETKSSLIRLALKINVFVCAYIRRTNCISKKDQGERYDISSVMRAYIIDDHANHACIFGFCSKYNRNQRTGFN